MNTSADPALRTPAATPQGVLLPLALAQFICSYATSNMNVAINDIATDLGTTVGGVQTTIAVFTLTMAALMIPGSKLTDILGRTYLFRRGLMVYGVGALVAAAAPGLGVLILGYSLLEGIGTALLIPPVYILATIFYPDLTSRARAFGAISAAGGIGAAAGPLIGGIITTTISWRAAFVVQALVVGIVIIQSRKIVDPGVQGEKTAFDIVGTILSAAGLFFIVVGILQASTYGWVRAGQDFVIGNTVVIREGGISPVWIFVLIGVVLLALFFRHIRARERAGKEPLLSTRLFKNRTSNLGLITQNIQWLVLVGLSFVVSVYLQTVRGYSAIETGLILTPATIGVLLSSMAAGRLARRRPQALLIRRGFVVTVAGILLLLLLVRETSNVLTFVPGLFLVGFGVGVMLTSSVTVVQSAFPEEDQGEISGLSRSVSNLGSSLGVAIAGTVIVSSLVEGNLGYALALVVLVVFAVGGLAAAFLLPATPVPPAPEPGPGPA
ncbi:MULTISPECIES: MFS transporter [unclassified Methanoculleus]|mgnify:FL=1|uniref:MFS transporter n=1 Tax=unclassified Methanoculleus TaxID=2619537 RepID=UPI0025E987F6|nr:MULTISPECIES: MFS transporter [unclassified Methanoculleus]MCK9317709.1 MFS transporter [Methanoculleus sp.]MDD2253807.1 MFS transporter [Methanoculleus sp.]MDD2788057.1 MFS transporter [Methanoculleus sp.]MDD3216352.1 MFS transporter [Methanoculleus sp.]MDD4313937.1 MFS transporter [Methanoculleus sp.]